MNQGALQLQSHMEPLPREADVSPCKSVLWR